MDANPFCWHRPGKLVGRTRTCRTCGIGVEECPCSNFGRTPNPKCEACHGSAWVGIVRSAAETVRQMEGGGAD